ncbi:NmrA family NAD(P)-binding protein [Streptomyces sp. NPDC098789]|uniref:NmrA family NAD(P)-binding protein n=1 Tax=Streptomyces sp. NPDC098789 TaxID=3366098 RepID=UPI00380939C1
MILVTGATGMFGSRIVDELVGRGRAVRALVRDRDKAQRLLPPEAGLAVGDMDDEASLAASLSGVRTVFLVSPMDEHVLTRESAVIRVAAEAGVHRIVKLYGCVRHDGDPLDQLHQASIAVLRASGLEWSLVSPNSVMETSLLPHAESVRGSGELWACAGGGRVGFVAADDVARAAAAVLTSEGPSGTNYEITGPEALSMTDIAACAAETLGRPVVYRDVPEEDFRAVLTGSGLSPQEAEFGVILHMRAWREGKAELVTGTYESLTGAAPTSVGTWFRRHRGLFG